MLRRHSVKSKSDPRRRKSTSSARGVHLEHIDPVSAQRDAQVAACQAYTRALNRAAAEMPLFPPTPDSSPQKRQADWGQTGGSEDLRRRQSVRFVGSCSVQGRTSQSESTYTRLGSTDAEPDPAQMQDDYDTSSSESIGLGNPGSQSAQRLALQIFRHPRGEPPLIPLPGIAAGYIDALAAGDEYYTPEDDVASAPSSYRRLRRSRSLFTSKDHRARTSQEGSATFAGGKPLHSDPRDDLPTQIVPQLRAPRSMSFLRNRHILAGPRTSRASNRDFSEQAISELPKIRPLMTAQSTPHLGPKTSALFGRGNRYHEPLMRKSLRSGSSTDCLGSPQPTASLGKEESFKFRARKASRSLKTKLKSFFSLSRSEEQPPTIPIQHIDSQRTHVSEDFESLPPSDTIHSTSDWGPIHRVPSRLPSVQTVPANIVHSNRVSLESLQSESERKVSNDGSLTSWANSGPSTLTSQQQQQWRSEWERQRLSVIKENGAHAPSQSLRRQDIEPQLLQHAGVSLKTPTPPGPIPDSQRIYSALMKRVRAISERTKQIIEQQERSDTNSHHTQCLLAPTQSSSNTQGSIQTEDGDGIGHDIPWPDAFATPTRASRGAGLPDGRNRRIERLGAGTSANQDRYATYFEQPPAHVEQLASSEARKRRFVFSSTEDSQISSSDPFTSRPPSRLLPAEDIKTYSDRGSAFFGSPPSHLFRTASLYRRALRKSMEEEPTPRKQDGSEADFLNSEEGTQVHVHNDADYTESVYSTDDFEAFQITGRPKLSLNQYRHGALVSPITYQPAGYRTDSSGSSIDWKTWLSANVAKLESSPPKPAEVEYALPTMPQNFPSGHVRELAQTHEDYEEDTKTPEPPIRVPTLPTSPLATLELNVVKLSPQHYSSKRATPPTNRPSLHENNSPSHTPPVPPKNALRTAHSPLKRSGPNTGYHITPSISSSPELSAAVQRQFGPVSKVSGRGHNCMANEACEYSNGDNEVYMKHRYQEPPSSDGAGAFI